MKKQFLFAIAASLAAAPLQAQMPATKSFVEGLVGAAVPTFDIADVATTGTAFGATLGYRLSPAIVLMGEFDYGMHKDKATEQVDINTLHYMGKVGYDVYARDRVTVTVNLGAGVLQFA